jgi:L-Ala-D/L-Glu epimerase
MTSRTLRVAAEKWPLKEPIRITGHTFTDSELVVVMLQQEGLTGRGEAAGVYYLHDDVSSMVKRIEGVRGPLEAGADRQALQALLPPGGARNALDCAMWELEAKRAARAIWQIAGLESPKPLLTTCTLGADTPERMAASARAFADARALKLKLTGEPVDADRVRAVRDARPEVWLGVDANQGYTRGLLERALPAFVGSGVKLIEQPLPRGEEAQLATFQSPIPIAADESVQSSSDLARFARFFDVINIKLDKCGGLTEGLAMVRLARDLGVDVMVGNMVGTSLAMAPAFLVGQLCTVVDLDGPLLLRSDRSPSVRYEHGELWCPEAVWGGPHLENSS